MPAERVRDEAEVACWRCGAVTTRSTKVIRLVRSSRYGGSLIGIWIATQRSNAAWAPLESWPAVVGSFSESLVEGAAACPPSWLQVEPTLCRAVFRTRTGVRQQRLFNTFSQRREDVDGGREAKHLI